MTPYQLGTGIGIGFWVLVGYLIWRNYTWQGTFAKLVESGKPAKARKLMDRWARKRKPSASVPLRRLPQHRARLVGLWSLGELAELRTELERDGGPTYIGQAHVWGVLALATEPGDHADLESMLDTLEAKLASETRRATAPNRDHAALLIRVTRGVIRGNLADADARALALATLTEQVSTRILVFRALDVAADRAGLPSNAMKRQLLKLTRRFAPPAAA